MVVVVVVAVVVVICLWYRVTPSEQPRSGSWQADGAWLSWRKAEGCAAPSGVGV